MAISGTLQFDEARMAAAMKTVREKLSANIEEVCDLTVTYAKANSPVGWDQGTNRLPIVKSKKPRGYVGGTNKKSITADFLGENGVKTIGEVPSAGTTFADRNWTGFLSFIFRVYTQSGYGGWLELGTKKMSARPYIYTGFMRAVERLNQLMTGSI